MGQQLKILITGVQSGYHWEATPCGLGPCGGHPQAGHPLQSSYFALGHCGAHWVTPWYIPAISGSMCAGAGRSAHQLCRGRPPPCQHGAHALGPNQWPMGHPLFSCFPANAISRPPASPMAGLRIFRLCGCGLRLPIYQVCQF